MPCERNFDHHSGAGTQVFVFGSLIIEPGVDCEFSFPFHFKPSRSQREADLVAKVIVEDFSTCSQPKAS